MFGFFIAGDKGRTRPKLLIAPERNGCKLVALGSFGYAVRTAQASGSEGIRLIAPERVKQSVAEMLAVVRFFPSKIRESPEILRKAISVTTAPAARAPSAVSSSDAAPAILVLRQTILTPRNSTICCLGVGRLTVVIH